MKIFLKNISLLILNIFSYLNIFLPKFNIIILFTNNTESNDNNRALLKLLVERKIYENYKIYFFSKDAKRYKHFIQVKYKSVLFAPIYFLFSKYCFYDCGTIKIKPSKKQYVISLWHGVPLKKIGLMIKEQTSKLDKYNDFSKIIVPSKYWVEIYKQSFNCTDDQIFINGFPRNDFLFKPNYKKIELLGIHDKYEKNLLWMPTFRTSIGGRYSDTIDSEKWDLPIFDSLLELIELNSRLQQNNIQMVIKLHPYSTLNLSIPKDLSNIKFLRNKDLNKIGIINYEFVAYFDILITDYSSVLFDYLLTNKPMAFTIDDIEQYETGRGFNVSNPKKYLVGPNLTDKNSFLRYIDLIHKEQDEFISQRENIKQETFKYMDDKSTERLLIEVGLL